MIICDCGKTFSNPISHKDHLRDSSRHANSKQGVPTGQPTTAAKTAVTCPCGQRFATADALQDHIRDSPKHAQTRSETAGPALEIERDAFKCDCGKSFASSDARRQHLGDAPRHVKKAIATSSNSEPSSQQPHQPRITPPVEKKLTCSCGAAFASPQAKADHLRDSSVHNRRPPPHGVTNKPLETRKETSTANCALDSHRSAPTPEVSTLAEPAGEGENAKGGGRDTKDGESKGSDESEERAMTAEKDRRDDRNESEGRDKSEEKERSDESDETCEDKITSGTSGWYLVPRCESDSDGQSLSWKRVLGRWRIWSIWRWQWG